MPEGVQTVRHLFFAIALSRGRQIQTYMLKYVNTDIVFQEIPDEVTLSINISNCPCHCPGCHSSYLWDDTGEKFNKDTIDAFMKRYGEDITCVCMMGGDSDPTEVQTLADYIHSAYPLIKAGWYSGKQNIPQHIDKKSFDYIKLGPYIEHLGGLKEKTTNQRLYKKLHDGSFQDITSRFWKK